MGQEDGHNTERVEWVTELQGLIASKLQIEHLIERFVRSFFLSAAR